jgi:uncharacterized protein YcaQ
VDGRPLARLTSPLAMHRLTKAQARRIALRVQELFEFEYTFEMYKPAAKRRWGYFALPVLHEDRLVGKVDAATDRKASALRVNAIHTDVKFTRAMSKAVQAELEDLALWIGLEAVGREV